MHYYNFPLVAEECLIAEHCSLLGIETLENIPSAKPWMLPQWLWRVVRFLLVMCFKLDFLHVCKQWSRQLDHQQGKGFHVCGSKEVDLKSMNIWRSIYSVFRLKEYSTWAHSFISTVDISDLTRFFVIKSITIFVY